MNNWFLASAVPAPIQTPNTGWSLLPLACLVIDQLGIDRKDVIIHMVNHRAGLAFALLAIEAVHGMKYDAQKALNGKVAGLVGLKPLAFYARLLNESATWCQPCLNLYSKLTSRVSLLPESLL